MNLPQCSKKVKKTNKQTNTRDLHYHEFCYRNNYMYSHHCVFVFLAFEINQCNSSLWININWANITKHILWLMCQTLTKICEFHFQHILLDRTMSSTKLIKFIIQVKIGNVQQDKTCGNAMWTLLSTQNIQFPQFLIKNDAF